MGDRGGDVGIDRDIRDGRADTDSRCRHQEERVGRCSGERDEPEAGECPGEGTPTGEVYGDVCRGDVAEQVADAKTGQDEAVAADPEMVAVCDGERDGNGEGWPSEVAEPA